MKEFEKQLRSLLKGKYSSLSLTFNDENGPNYKTVLDELTSPQRGSGKSWIDEGWVSNEERVKACEENSCWTLQWYPDTPVGFCILRASSIQAIFDELAREY